MTDEFPNLLFGNSSNIHEQNKKEIMSVEEYVYMIQTSLDLHINYNFDFLILYKIYFQKLLCE